MRNVHALQFLHGQLKAQGYQGTITTLSSMVEVAEQRGLRHMLRHMFPKERRGIARRALLRAFHHAYRRGRRYTVTLQSHTHRGIVRVRFNPPDAFTGVYLYTIDVYEDAIEWVFMTHEGECYKHIR